MTQKRDSEAVNFLTLPRELRQKILYESFEDALEQDVGFNTNHAILHYLLSTYRETCDRPVSAHNIGSWASTLAATNDIMSIDLGYVMKKRLEELEARYATKQEEEDYDCPFRNMTQDTAPRPKAEGLHDWKVVSSLENFRRWTRARILYGPWDRSMDRSMARSMANALSVRRARDTFEETFEIRRMYQREKRAQRKKTLTGMVKAAVCLQDGCHHG